MIVSSSSSPATLRRLIWAIAALAAVAAAVVAWQSIVAQVGGDRGIAPIAASRDISIGGIEVEASGKNADEARENGWREAQRKAWAKLGGPAVPDSRIESMVSAVVIEREQIGPRRYVATLGVIFDKQRAGSILGQRGSRSRSAPMLLLPVLIEGGAPIMFEKRNEWQRVWAEYQAGASAIDYVRPSGSGGESLLLTYGQTQRRSRLWWRNILNDFSAADVIVPIAKLQREYPGGPIKGTFIARYGPENKFLEQFELKVDNDEEMTGMLELARTRFDAIFTKALREGKLKPDPTLGRQQITLTPEIQALINAARGGNRPSTSEQASRPSPSSSSNNSSASESSQSASTETPTTVEPDAPPPEVAVNSYSVQFPTPDPASLDAALGSVRGTPGVRGVAISSTALGGVSVMRVTYAGDLSGLAAALRSRGWSVNQGAGGLGISR